MIVDGSGDAIYVSGGSSLWRVPINGDGSAGDVELVSLTDDGGADFTWGGAGGMSASPGDQQSGPSQMPSTRPRCASIPSYGLERKSINAPRCCTSSVRVAKMSSSPSPSTSVT